MSLSPEKKPEGYPPTPELDRRSLVTPYSHKIGEFLDWLEQEKKWTLCEAHQHTDGCYDVDGRKQCGLQKDEYLPVHFQIEKLLAEFFEIDLKKVQAEQDAILDYLHEQEMERQLGHGPVQG